MPGRDNGGGVMALVEQSIMHAPTDITIRVAAAAAAHDWQWQEIEAYFFAVF